MGRNGRQGRKRCAQASTATVVVVYEPHRKSFRRCLPTLETDVQENPARCEELLTGLEQAYSGKRFEAYGNLYELEAGPMGVELRKGYDDARAPLRLAIADLKRALAAWRRAIG